MKEVKHTNTHNVCKTPPELKKKKNPLSHLLNLKSNHFKKKQQVGN